VSTSFVEPALVWSKLLTATAWVAESGATAGCRRQVSTRCHALIPHWAVPAPQLLKVLLLLRMMIRCGQQLARAHQPLGLCLE
jgi:hypothetical protein